MGWPVSVSFLLPLSGNGVTCDRKCRGVRLSRFVVLPSQALLLLSMHVEGVWKGVGTVHRWTDCGVLVLRALIYIWCTRNYSLHFVALWLLCVPPGLTFSNSTFCPHSVFMCFVWIWEQTAIISLYSINWLVFITEI